MCLARAGLSIGEDGAVETLQNGFNDGDDGLVVDFPLGRVRIEHPIEVVLDRSVLTGLWVRALHATRLLVIEGDTRFRTIRSLSRI